MKKEQVELPWFDSWSSARPTLAISLPQGDIGVYRAHVAAAQVNGDVGQLK
jgi:hypothetical protein